MQKPKIKNMLQISMVMIPYTVFIVYLTAKVFR